MSANTTFCFQTHFKAANAEGEKHVEIFPAHVMARRGSFVNLHPLGGQLFIKQKMEIGSFQEEN